MENTQLVGENFEHLDESEHSEKAWGRLASTSGNVNNIDLVKDRMTIGRAASNDVVLTHAGK